MSVEIVQMNCLDKRYYIGEDLVDIVVTSPPYNLGINYVEYVDKVPDEEYFFFLENVFKKIARVMRDGGSFFLNVGGSNKYPWRHLDIANIARKFFVLQNEIVWVKSISIGDESHGQFKPINSNRYLNGLHEHIYHFTKNGDVVLDRKAIGVPFADKSNIKRWKGNGQDLRCRGNVWFIPYETIQSKKEKGNHPAIFPEQLVEWCIRLHGYDKYTVVWDPFAGSGTTLAVAQKLGVNAVGHEIDGEYVAYCKKRLGQGGSNEN